MSLLLESKRMWLLSYIICAIIPCILYKLVWDTEIGKTIGIFFTEIQLVIFIFFWLILIFKWKTGCRLVATIAYLGITTYEGVIGNLCKWYVIILMFLITEIYMLWNLGGVVNCVIANAYKSKLNSGVSLGKTSYDAYVDEVENYNSRNNLDSWRKVKIRKEPDWEMLGFNSSGVEMFYFENAILGINTLYWERSELELNKINTRLDEKHRALYNSKAMYEEKELLNQIISKDKEVGVNTSSKEEQVKILNAVRRKNIKKEKNILRRRL